MSTTALRDEAYETGRDLDRRDYSNEALQGAVLRLCGRLMDAADELDRTYAVAHAAWHLLDDSGETGETDDNGKPIYEHMHLDHERVSAALDVLESAGWSLHGGVCDG